MVIFLDTNIPVYLIGDDEVIKSQVRHTLKQQIEKHATFVTNVEVLQEILHIYSSRLRKSGNASWLAKCEEAFLQVRTLCTELWPITHDDALNALAWIKQNFHSSSRDALHLATMRFHGIDTILSGDRHFDGIEGINRINPLAEPPPQVAERPARYGRGKTGPSRRAK